MEIANERYVGEAPMAEDPQEALSLVLKDKCVKTNHLDDDCVTTPKLHDKSVTPAKVSDDFQSTLVEPLTSQVDNKYQNITNELYSMIASLQVGGIALSQQFGDRTDIGISQKALTKAIGRILDELGQLSGKQYMDYTLSVVPSVVYKEGTAVVTVTADASDAISDFDNIKVYRNNQLVAESSDISKYITSVEIDSDSVIKVEGVIMGKTTTKTQEIKKAVPFFMGSGQNYAEVMTLDNLKPLDGTIEGDYDTTVKNNGDYIFIIIPISRKEEFRRCKLDMNGFEIPVTTSETADFIIVQSINTYKAGTYNIDIDINS